MDEEVTIRRLTREDADGVRQLDAQILGRNRSATWDEYLERFLAVSKVSTISLPWAGSQVAEDGGKGVGFILSERQSTGYGLPIGARIVGIAVHPAYRRQGVGTRLITALQEYSRNTGIATIYSLLQANDARDAAFLQACDFQEAAVRVFKRNS